MSVYTLAFREDGGASCTYGPEDRLEVAAELMAAIGAGDEQAVFALPAGYVVAPSTARRDEWADGVAEASRNAGVAIVLGMDVAEREVWGVERCPRSFVYAIDRGRRLLWGVAPTARATGLEGRTVSLGTVRATVLLGRELFGARSAAVVEKARPDLVLVLGHGGPTKKWVPPLMALDELAPTFLVHQALAVRRPVKLPPPRGWCATVSRGAIQVICYRRQADGAGARIVGN
ncbi:MAG: hypothetical protein JWM53_6109 [bacterium]|nr:hypothetical protein [bacterium]